MDVWREIQQELWLRKKHWLTMAALLERRTAGSAAKHVNVIRCVTFTLLGRHHDRDMTRSGEIMAKAPARRD